jgi:hypothetical protein
MAYDRAAIALPDSPLPDSPGLGITGLAAGAA